MAVIASKTKQSVNLREVAFKLPSINPKDWFSETPIPHVRNDSHLYFLSDHKFIVKTL